MSHHDIAKEIEKLADDLGIDRKRSIGEVAKELKVATHIIRFWEEKFPQIQPEIGNGKRRYYYNKQLKTLKRIKKFLYEEGYTIAGLQKLLKKRKQDNYKEEDLDIILHSEFSEEEKKLLLHDSIQEDDNSKNYQIDDFIEQNSDSKLLRKDMAEAEILLRNVKKNLSDLKYILQKSIL
ncbi:MAG: MerR family transcriptional regulator [Pelagibacterales bacterium]|nr:MerR family transcriptional regulator [Pelagibacterales bacterium]